MIDFSSISWLDLAPFVAIGFLAQVVDGTVGMGFGVMTNSLLVALGLPGPAASAAVRTAESFTSGISGLSQATELVRASRQKFDRHYRTQAIVGAREPLEQLTRPTIAVDRAG